MIFMEDGPKIKDVSQEVYTATLARDVPARAGRGPTEERDSGSEGLGCHRVEDSSYAGIGEDLLDSLRLRTRT